jgi:hypothetical protein
MKYVKHVFTIKIINKNVLVVNREILQDLKINVFKIQNYGKIAYYLEGTKYTFLKFNLYKLNCNKTKK